MRARRFIVCLHRSAFALRETPSTVAVMLTAALSACAATPVGGPPYRMHPVRVVVEGVRSNVGLLRVGVYADPKTFLKSDGFASGVSIPASQHDVVVSVPEGIPVVISVFQDLDENEQLRRGLFGIPLEPWGFSGKPSPVGPPVWKACAIEPAENATVTITLHGGA